MPCCDLCVRRKSEDPQCQLSDAERNLLTLIGRVGARTRPNTDHQVIDVDAVTIAKKPGLRRKERLQLCQEALECWRQDLWNQDYLDSAISPRALMSDAIITKLATRTHLSTTEDIKSDIPEWTLVDQYGAQALNAVKNADDSWKTEHAKQLEMNKAKRQRQSLENKERREEERRVQKRAESVRKNAEKAFADSQNIQWNVTHPLPFLANYPQHQPSYQWSPPLPFPADHSQPYQYQSYSQPIRFDTPIQPAMQQHLSASQSTQPVFIHYHPPQ